jgi:hypothetical protein
MAMPLFSRIINIILEYCLFNKGKKWIGGTKASALVKGEGQEAAERKERTRTRQ